MQTFLLGIVSPRVDQLENMLTLGLCELGAVLFQRLLFSQVNQNVIAYLVA